MKTIYFLILGIFLLSLTACEEDKEDLSTDGLTIFECTLSTSSIIQPECEVLVTDEDVIGYDPNKYTFVISDAGKTRISNSKQVDIALGIDGEIVYAAKLIPWTSSLMVTDYLVINPMSMNNQFKVYLGYPENPAEFTGQDNRNHERLITYLESVNKIITIKN